MKNREQLHELILQMGADGKEIYIEELAKMDGIVDTTYVSQIATRNVIMQQLRVLVGRVFRDQGQTVRSVRKNVYKVVDEKDPKDCQRELKRKISKMNRAIEMVEKYKAFMIQKGYPIQLEMVSLVLEGSEANAQDQKQSTFKPTVRTSSKSKKVVNG